MKILFLGIGAEENETEGVPWPSGVCQKLDSWIY